MRRGHAECMETDILERRLDEALDATFPASDPIAVSVPAQDQ